jgi:hypothetical protein
LPPDEIHELNRNPDHGSFDLYSPSPSPSRYLATVPYEIEGFIFLPEQDPYTPGEYPRVLKWKENDTIEFRLKISDKFSRTGILLEKEAISFSITSIVLSRRCVTCRLCRSMTIKLFHVRTKMVNGTFIGYVMIGYFPIQNNQLWVL